MQPFAFFYTNSLNMKPAPVLLALVRAGQERWQAAVRGNPRNQLIGDADAGRHCYPPLPGEGQFLIFHSICMEMKK